jgi:hypothetical protein
MRNPPFLIAGRSDCANDGCAAGAPAANACAASVNHVTQIVICLNMGNDPFAVLEGLYCRPAKNVVKIAMK